MCEDVDECGFTTSGSRHDEPVNFLLPLVLGERHVAHDLLDGCEMTELGEDGPRLVVVLVAVAVTGREGEIVAHAAVEEGSGGEDPCWMHARARRKRGPDLENMFDCILNDLDGNALCKCFNVCVDVDEDGGCSRIWWM